MSDKVEELVLAHAKACVEALLGEAPRAEVAVQESGGWTVFVITVPTRNSQGISGLTKCERGCLAVLAAAEVPMSAPQIQKAIEEHPDPAVKEIWSDVTVKRSLAKLRNSYKLLTNTTRHPRGYSLNGNHPLFRRAAS